MRTSLLTHWTSPAANFTLPRIFARTTLVSALLLGPTIGTARSQQAPPAKPPKAAPPVARPVAPAQQPGPKPAAGVNPAAPGAKPAVPGAKPAVPGAKPPAAGAKPPAGAAVAGKKKEKPPMQPLDLVTADGVQIRAYYFPSTVGKEAIPVIVVHEFESQAGVYAGLVRKLSDLGCAVIVPDLRGHGASRPQATTEKSKVDLSKMTKVDVLATITGDLEAVKKFLVLENNAERLNLNALAMVGIGEGAVIAGQWAMRDLNFPSTGTIKQGQDVKAMVLVSPRRSHKGVSLEDALNDPLLATLPFLIVFGNESPHLGDSERLVKKLETAKKRITRGEPVGLTVSPVKSSLTGKQLVSDVPDTVTKIAAFLDQLVKNAPRIPWVERPER
jgi:alpha-beta hydrolase superfamily lysophospholipase